MPKYEVRWQRIIESPTAIAAATEAAKRLRANAPDPADFLFMTRRVPEGDISTRRAKIFVDVAAVDVMGSMPEPDLLKDLLRAMLRAWPQLSPETRRRVHVELNQMVTPKGEAK